MTTQELIANMLGVRREGVTEGALKLNAQQSFDTRVGTAQCQIVPGLRSTPASATPSSKKKTTGRLP